MSNTVKIALTFLSHFTKENQLDESGVVNSELSVSQVYQELAQSRWPGAVLRDTLATTAMIPNSKSRNIVVRRVTRTRRIVKTIKVTSKRVTFGSVSVQEDGPKNEVIEAVEDKMLEASSTEVLHHVLGSAEEIVNLLEMKWYLFLSELKEGNIHGIVTPAPKESFVDCCSPSTMNEIVLETDKTKDLLLMAGIPLKGVLFTNFCESNVVSSYRSAKPPTSRQGYQARD